MGPATRGGGSVFALALAGLSAVLASTCCVVPLLFALAGLSGAWMSQVRWLAPYSTALIVLAVVSLAVAGLRLYRGGLAGGPVCEADACADGDAATGARANARARRVFWAVALLTLIPIVVPLVAPMFYQETP